MVKYDKSTKQIQMNRGDSTTLKINAKDSNGNNYEFKQGEKINFVITERKNVENVVFSKTITVAEDSYNVDFPITSEESKIGELINKPVVYWYEISVEMSNNDIQTIIGYDEDGAKEFVLNPEASEE